MVAAPIHKREYHAFLSHSSKDKHRIVEQIFHWFTEIAKIPIWYDRDALQAGANFPTRIAQGISRCRAIIIILSKASVASGWVEEEINYAINHQKQYSDFKIIPVMIEDCNIEGLLETRTHIRLKLEEPDIEFYDELLKAIYFDNLGIQLDRHIDVYTSRTWRPSGTPFADKICKQFINARIRLIGDAEDQTHFSDSKSRVENIVSSCGGLLAILPYRADEGLEGYTSKYIVEEIRYAQKHQIPYAIFSEKGVVIPADIEENSIYCHQSTDLEDAAIETSVADGIELLLEYYNRNHHRHYVFFATDFANTQRNHIIQTAIQRITSMQCVIGENIQSKANKSVQEEIFEQIRKAFLVVADVTNDNINTLIELGAARGANVPYQIICFGDSRRPPFMFRDKQIHFYKNDIELLGIAHKLSYPSRRRILNYEFSK